MSTSTLRAMELTLIFILFSPPVNARTPPLRSDFLAILSFSLYVYVCVSLSLSPIVKLVREVKRVVLEGKGRDELKGSFTYVDMVAWFCRMVFVLCVDDHRIFNGSQAVFVLRKRHHFAIWIVCVVFVSREMAPFNLRLPCRFFFFFLSERLIC